LRIRCSKGTYIRSIARDLGLALESGGHLINLKRTVSGENQLQNAVSMEEILNS
jgi:tRNA pseudouridine55 synthase